MVVQSHPRLEQVAFAFVVRDENTGDEAALRAAILAHCEQKLSHFKRPLAVHFIDALPAGMLNKTSKVKLREMAEALKAD